LVAQPRFKAIDIGALNTKYAVDNAATVRERALDFG